MTPETIAAGLAFFQGKRVENIRTGEKFQLSDLKGKSSVYFSDLEEYRILPDLPWYRVALMAKGALKSTTTADNPDEESMFKKSAHFVCWLTERVTYDPEQVGK